MNPVRCSLVLGMLAVSSLLTACSEEFDDAPASPAGTVTDGGAGKGGSGGTGGAGGAGGADAAAGFGAMAGTGGDAGIPTGGTGGTGGSGGTGTGGDSDGSVGGSAGEGGDAGLDGSAGEGGQDASACPAGSGDCDSDPTDCETSLQTVDNCGACGIACSGGDNATAACESGVCTLACTGTYGNCDGSDANGCETDLSSSAGNCGSCGEVCSGENGTPTCSAGACGIDCTTNWENCDGNLSNGCEANLLTNPLHCGTCGHVCPTPPNATATCAGGQCGFSCTGTWADCNGNAADGCETNLNTNLANCGGCGNACSSTNGTPGCASGVCSILCNTNYGNCDGVLGNGCEVNLTGSAAHCGSCGHDCEGGGCKNSYCEAWTLATLPYSDWPPGGVAANSTHVYWASPAGICRVPVTGGSPQVLTAASSPDGLAIDATHVYWTTYQYPEGGVYRMPLSGGTVQTLASSQALAQGLAIDDTTVYWGYDGGLRKISKTGTSLTTLATGYGSVAGVAVDASTGYFLSRGAEKLLSVAKTGGTVTDLSDELNPIAIVLDSTHLYFTNGTELVKIGKNGVGRTVLASGYTSLYGLDIDDTHVFISDIMGAAIVQTPKASGAKVTRHTGGGPANMKLSNGVLYWRDAGDHRIYAMVK